MFKKYLKYIYILIFFYLIWLIIIPLTFRISINPILNCIQHKTGLKIKLDNPRLRTNIIPNILVKANSVIIYDNNNTTILNLNNSKLNFRLLPLITGKIHINNFQSDSIFVKFYLKDKLYFANLPINSKANSIKFQLNKLKINNFNILFDNNSKIYTLNGENYFIGPIIDK